MYKTLKRSVKITANLSAFDCYAKCFLNMQKKKLARDLKWTTVKVTIFHLHACIMYKLISKEGHQKHCSVFIIINHDEKKKGGGI